MNLKLSIMRDLMPITGEVKDARGGGFEFATGLVKIYFAHSMSEDSW